MEKKTGTKKKEVTPRPWRHSVAAWVVEVLIPGYHIARNPDRKKLRKGDLSANKSGSLLSQAVERVAPADQEVSHG